MIYFYTPVFETGRIMVYQCPTVRPFHMSRSNLRTPWPIHFKLLIVIGIDSLMVCILFGEISIFIPPIFRHIFLNNYWWQESDIWSQASYRYPISWEVFLDPSDSYFLFADLVGFYTHWTYMHIFLSNYWWQRFDIWSQASYRYPISWEAFLDPSDSFFLFAEERGYHKWALAHSSSYSFQSYGTLFIKL